MVLVSKDFLPDAKAPDRPNDIIVDTVFVMSHLGWTDEGTWAETAFFKLASVRYGNQSVHLTMDNQCRTGHLMHLTQIIELLSEQYCQESDFAGCDAFERR